jgi:hypothetical protein
MVLPGDKDNVGLHENLNIKIPSGRGNRYMIKVKALISPCLLTDYTAKPIVALWGELTPRGNMVHQGVEREDSVQDQLVLGSLNSSQDLRRT